MINDDLRSARSQRRRRRHRRRPHHVGRRRPKPAWHASRSGSRAPTPSCASTRRRRWSRRARWTRSSPPASGAARCTACRWRTRTCTTARASSRPAAARSAATGWRRSPRRRCKKLDAAGVVELGFLNMAEFAAGPTGHNVHHGHCRNPWDEKRVTGGSSSGSGASVAARMVYGALGSDTGGSIRLPAAACGVVGMKATYGRVSRAGAVARSWSLDHVGPLTRTVRDNARMLARRRRPRPRRFDDQREAGAGLRGAARGRRRGPEDRPRPAERRAGAARCAGGRRRAGGGRCAGQARREDLAGDDARLHRALSLGRSDGEVRGGRHAPAVDGEDARALRQPGAHAHGSGLLHPGDAVHRRAAPARAFRARSSSRRRWTASMPCCCPPSPSPSRRSRRPTPRRIGRTRRRSRWWRGFTGLTRPFNTLGVPALSVPCGFDSNGAPIGLQLIGRPFDEALLYRVGHAYQGATEHHKKVPV